MHIHVSLCTVRVSMLRSAALPGCGGSLDLMNDQLLFPTFACKNGQTDLLRDRPKTAADGPKISPLGLQDHPKEPTGYTKIMFISRHTHETSDVAQKSF